MSLSDEIQRIKRDVKRAEMRGREGEDSRLTSARVNVEGIWKAIDAIVAALEERK